MNRETPSKLGRWMQQWSAISIVVFLFAGFTLPIVGSIPFEFAGLVLFGWFDYLQRIPSEVRPDSGVIVGAIVALGVATWALHRCLRWWRARTGVQPVSWRIGWTVRITILVLVLFGASLAVGCVVHQVAWLSEEPKLIEMRGMGRQTRELSNLKQLATAMKLYAIDHQGQFPKRPEELIPEYIMDHQLLFTLANEDDPPQRVIYYPGYKETDAENTIVLASPRFWGNGAKARRAIACLDTSASIILESKYQELMQKQRLAAGQGDRTEIDAASAPPGQKEADHE